MQRKVRRKKRDQPKDAVERLVDRVCSFLGLGRHKIFWRQFIKFAIVGVFNTVIDWSLFYILTSVAGLNPLLANIISYTVAMVYNFFASTRFVFRTTKQKSQRRLFAEFAAQNACGFLISEGLLYVLIERMSLQDMLSKVIATGVVMIFDFVSRKIILEDRPKRRKSGKNKTRSRRRSS